MQERRKTMATIKTSIMVHDGMSMALRHMNSAVMSVVNSFEQMQAATNEPINTAGYTAIKKDLALATQAMGQFEQAVQEAEVEQQQMNQSLNQGSSAFKNMVGGVVGLVGAYVSLQQAAKLVDFATEYSNATSRIAMMNDGLQTTAELQQMIYQTAQNSLAAYDTTADLVARLGNNAASAFTSSKEIVEFAELVQKSFSIAGTSAVEASNAALQLSQALGSGVLRGDELNSIFEQAPNLIQNIANYLDVPIGKIREMAADGELTAQVVKEAMFAASDDINNKFSAMPQTWSDIWTTMVNYAQNKAAGLAVRISNFFNSDTFQFFQMAATKAIDIVVAGLNLIVMVLAGLANWVALVGQFFVDNWSWIAPILMTIAIVLGSIVTILAVKYAILGLVRAATLAWAAAQWVVNAAYLTSPITWVLIAIIAVIALIVYALYAWGEQTATVVGYVAGIFAALGAFILNLIAGIANIFIMFAEFFINLFIDPVYAVKKLFYDMAVDILKQMEALGVNIDKVALAIGNAFVAGANIAIGAINWIIDALNKIDGVDIGKVGKLSYSGTNVGSTLRGLTEGLHAPTSDKNVVELERFEPINVIDAFGSGFDWGYDLTMSASDAVNGLVDKAMGLVNYDFGNDGHSPLGDLLQGYGLGKDDYLDALNSINDSLDDANDKAGKTAKNTGKLADKAKLTKDDIAYLREQVAGNFNNIFKNLNVKVDMKNDNYINGEMDIDGVIDRFGERVEEVALNFAEGGGVDV